MATATRHLAWVLLLALLAGCAAAGGRGGGAPDSFDAGDWWGTISRNDQGRATLCSVAAEFDGDYRIAVAMDRDGGWSIMLNREGWHLGSGSRYPVTLLFGRERHEAEGIVYTKALWIDMPDRLWSSFAAARFLDVEAARESFGFDLDSSDFGRAATALERCRDRFLGAPAVSADSNPFAADAPARSGVASDNPFAAGSGGASVASSPAWSGSNLAGRLRALLLEAGVPNPLLTPRDATDKASFLWDSRPDGLRGFVIVGPDTTVSLTQLQPTIARTLLPFCPGASLRAVAHDPISRSGPAEVASGTLACADGQAANYVAARGPKRAIVLVMHSDSKSRALAGRVAASLLLKLLIFVQL